MYSRKLSGLILVVFTSIVLLASTLIFADGSPIPPLPPNPKSPAQSILVADGWPLPLPPPKPPAMQFHG